MPTGSQLMQTIKAAFLAFIREVKAAFSAHEVTNLVESAEGQLVINRIAAGAVVIIAVVLCLLPSENSMLQAAANALFKAASWLWSNGKAS